MQDMIKDWRFEADTLYGTIDGYTVLVADVIFDGDNYGESIKPLIAAAPDMLAALKMLRDADDIAILEGYSGGMGPDQRSKVDAVISKAKGKTEE